MPTASDDDILLLDYMLAIGPDTLPCTVSKLLRNSITCSQVCPHIYHGQNKYIFFQVFARRDVVVDIDSGPDPVLRPIDFSVSLNILV